MEEKKTIKLIGSGWGCASFLKNIDTNKYDVCVISNNLYFTYTPLLAYQTTHSINTLQHISNINPYIKYNKNTVTNIDFKNNTITMNNSKEKYDYLILCHGADVNTFNINGVSKYTHFLKTYKDVLNIKKELSKLKKNSNIAIIGCGPTGTEMVGNLLDYNKFNIYAIDGLSRPLNMYSEKISNYVINIWKNNNVNLYFNNFVNKIDNKNIYFKNNKINYDMAIWCGGIKKNSLTNNINNQLNNDCRFGIPVTPYLNVIHNLPHKNYFNYIYYLIFTPNFKNYTNNVYAIGDCAYSKYQPTAQVAYQQGKYLADNFNNDFKNIEPFKLENKGQICYVGNKKSVYQLNTFTSSGNLTYYANKFIHIYNAINQHQSVNFIRDLFR